MDLFAQEEAFAAIVSRMEDPEDRIDRRAIIIDCIVGLFGSVLAAVAVFAGWPLWVVLVGFVALAAADVIGAVLLTRPLPCLSHQAEVRQPL